MHESFRVQQVAGMFDVPIAEKAVERFEAELPDEDEEWSIGLVVGPSGSGKSTIARQAYGQELYTGSEWPDDKAVVDCFGDTPVRQVVELFTAVGFGSPPSWVKPYGVLSNGERFRCDLARSLAVGCRLSAVCDDQDSNDLESNDPGSESREPRAESRQPLVVFDEFTSVVDRSVAKVCSAAIAKGVRGGRLPCRFVAVTCHYDVAEWLEPDWVLDMATGELSRRRLRRPSIELEIHRCRLDAWRLFARHHYLSGSLALQARCYLATWNGEPVSFCATLPTIAQRGRRRFTRIVTLPDYQGVGIGTRTIAAVAERYREDGYRIGVTSSHPALVNHCRRSPDWRATSVKKTGQAASKKTLFTSYRNSAGRAVVSFEYHPRRAVS